MNSFPGRMSSSGTSSEQRPASQTALAVALLRAFHQLYDGEPKVLDDPVVLKLLEPQDLNKTKEEFARFESKPAKALRVHVVLRSRYAEDCLASAVSRGIRQFVTLGSGYDTFAYRQPDWAKELTIFEVDHPASQGAKKRRLTASGIALPPNLEFVPADFEASSLRDILARSSFDFSRPAFFSCLGVLVYLPQEAIDALFRLVGSLPQSSELVLTFSSPKSASGVESGFRQLAQAAAAVGEPWRTYHEPQALRCALVEAGFSSVDFLLPEQAERLYFAGRADKLPPPRRASIARAVV